MKHEGNWKINNYYYSVSGSGCVGHCTSLLQDPAQSICSDAMREGKEETGKLRQRIVSEVDGAAELLYPHSPRALAELGCPSLWEHLCSSARGTGPVQRGVGLMFWEMCFWQG